MKKNVLFSGLVALLVTLVTLFLFRYLDDRPSSAVYQEQTPAFPARFTVSEDGETFALDFTQTARKVMDAVVHIRSTTGTMAGGERQNQAPNQEIPQPFRDFFGDEFFDYFYRQGPNGPQQRPQMGSGSGVIINADGYIVTNNHVVRNAEEIEVALYDNRSFQARVVGSDPSTDLALLQIEAENLPTLSIGNSNEVQIGEWVLAVGNPFNLNSTVTAGIISAKGRNINILQDQYAVESFIQTDAAINPGNSGGALVDLQGNLIGINTAIASPTGSYSGYGFAVPANIVRKVVDDLMKYGTVYRGYLGVLIRGINSQFAQENNLQVNSGVYIDSLLENSAAGKAGIRKGDVILQIDERAVSTPAALQEIIATHRPGDRLEVVVDRKGKRQSFEVTLTDRDGRTTAANQKTDLPLSTRLGARFQTLDAPTARRLRLEGGVRVVSLGNGILSRDTEIREGFIITMIDKEPVRTAEDFLRRLEKRTGGVMIGGRYENVPGTQFYAFGLGD